MSGAAEGRRACARCWNWCSSTPFATRKPHQISGGQRQRVALARALARQPKLLLLDEPLAALDKKLREHTQFELMSIQQRTGVTFIVVTHDQEEAMTLSDRIAVMDKGEVKQIGSPGEVYEFPNSTLRGRLHRLHHLVSRPPSWRARTRSCALPFRPWAARSWRATCPASAEGQEATLAIRPEKLHHLEGAARRRQCLRRAR